MRIALLTTQVPFVFGGAELLAGNLREQLVIAGHEAEIVSIPFNWYPADRLRDSIVSAGLVDVSEFNGQPIDLVIGLKFPAYLARHPRKAFWLIHQHRQAYDMWDSGKSDLLSQTDGSLLKGAIDQADRKTLAEGPVFTISANVTKRLEQYNGISSMPLYHPPPIADLLHSAEPDDYVLVPSRLSPSKRQDLVLEALARTQSPVRAVFVGRPDQKAYGDQLLKRTEQLALRSRVTWRENVESRILAELYARSLAVVFIPEDEDYGYVTLEAMLSSKLVVTATDSGGPLEFVSDGQEAFVVAPDADSLARTLDRVWTERSLAVEMGKNGRRRYQELEITWDRVTRHLTGETPKSGRGQGPSAAEERPRTPLISSLAPEIVVHGEMLGQASPVANIGELLRMFDLGVPDDPPTIAYFQTHWLRYLASIAMLPKGSALRILDIGSSPPYILLALIKLLRPDSQFTVVFEDQPLDGTQQTFASRCSSGDLRVNIVSFNAERDRFPFPDAAFDVVLALEIVEHLALNPLHMFAEAHRVLAPSGSILVTTPNIVSARSMSLVHGGDSPYSFGVFVPHNGVYGRHNREYTPHEVELLGRATGFETTSLRTLNVYGDESRYFSLPLLSGSPYPLALRGRNIFYSGRRTDQKRPEAWKSFYVTDPLAIEGRLSVRESEAGTDVIEIVLKNEGKMPWLASGEGSVRLRFEVMTSEGRREGKFVELPLDTDIPPRSEHVMSLPIGRTPGSAVSLMRVDAILGGFGSLENLGIGPIQCLVSPGAYTYLSSLAR